MVTDILWLGKEFQVLMPAVVYLDTASPPWGDDFKAGGITAASSKAHCKSHASQADSVWRYPSLEKILIHWAFLMDRQPCLMLLQLGKRQFAMHDMHVRVGFCSYNKCFKVWLCQSHKKWQMLIWQPEINFKIVIACQYVKRSWLY